MEAILRALKRLIPRRLFSALQPAYHYLFAGASALWYGFPSRALFVVGVTGTKGKTSTTELVAAILEEAGHRVALTNTSRFKIAERSEGNAMRQSMLGRGRLQRFLRKAVDAGCDYAVLEMTSEGARQFRHAFIDLDALIFTNLSPEHIESHGSYENYVAAKLSLARALERGDWKKHLLVVNHDDAEASRFLAVRAGIKLVYGADDARPFRARREGSEITWRGMRIRLNLPGEFNIRNALAAATFAESRRIAPETIREALEKFARMPGRMERIEAGQDFTVIVDYAHTADSLERVLRVYADAEKICIMGGTGGGRDKAKRRVMGAVADAHCARIILTTEDPYDEDPADIASDVAEGILNRPHEYIADRREAIRKALRMATKGSAVFITGKGTDPSIMGPRGTRIPWSDALVAREELLKFLRGE